MVSNRRGFTLIELMVVVSIIGVLASIALPKYAYLKERALVTTMKSDLRNLLTSQEGFYVSNNDYAGTVTAGAEVPGTGGRGTTTWATSPGVEVVRVTYRSNSRRGVGWSAVVRHRGVLNRSSDQCGIFQGDVSFSPNRAVTEPGVSACW